MVNPCNNTEPWVSAIAEPNQKTAVIPAEKDKEVTSDDVSNSNSNARQPPRSGDLAAAKADHEAHAVGNGHLDSTAADLSMDKKAAVNGHANGNGLAKGKLADVEEGVDGDEKPAGRGMVLPFSPIMVTFRDMHYFVPLPEVRALLLMCAGALSMFSCPSDVACVRDSYYEPRQVHKNTA